MRKYSKNLKKLIKEWPINKKFCPNREFRSLILNETNFLNPKIKLRERIYYILNDIHNVILCPECNINPTSIRYIDNKYFIRSCSKKCDTKVRSLKNISGISKYDIAAKKCHNTMSQLDENGISGYTKSREKQHNTMSQLDENGISGHIKAAEICHNTMSQLDENGISGYTKSREKQHNTMSQLDKNGISGYTHAHKDRILNKKIDTYIKKINNFPKDYKLLTTQDEYINSTSKLLKYSHSCGLIQESFWPYIRCTTCYPYIKSMGENEVKELIKSKYNNIISNSRQIIKPLELDIYLPDYNLAIEYNGLYWHSSNSVDTENKIRHLYKTQECENQGIQLFHIFENEWLDPTKQAIWKSIILNRLGHSKRIFARKCIINQVSSKDKKQFLIDNHLQGDCVSSVNLGLYLDDELVALMTFGKSRFDKSVDWELLRFCNNKNTSVVGGASRLLKNFRSENNGSIISYADKRRSNGNLYKQLGFEFGHESNPNYFYITNGLLESRIKYQKHKLKDQLEIFDDTLTESQNMYNNGYRKIFDCGNQVWKLT